MVTENTNGTLSELRKLFFEAISESNYSESYRYFFEIRFNSLETFMKEKGIVKYTPKVGWDFLDLFMINHKKGISTELSLKTFIFKLNDIYNGIRFQARHNDIKKAALIGFQDILEEYASYCLENGNKASTVDYKIYNSTAFCRYLNSIDCYSIDQLEESKIIQACLSNANNNVWRCTRWFLEFLYQTGKCHIDYSYLVPKEIKKEPFPSVYTDEEIMQMEKAVDLSSNIGKRDICIMLLESRLMMRSGDIVNLTFDDVDFENNRIIFIQEKTEKSVNLPLLSEVKNSLREYIESARPRSDDKHIFLRVNAPFNPLTTGALRYISRNYLKKAKIDTAGRRSGPHARRASAATSMINSGASYDAVKKILGHTDPNTIRHYAALDKNHLRCCALQAPSPTGVLKELLEGRCAL